MARSAGIGDIAEIRGRDHGVDDRFAGASKQGDFNPCQTSQYRTVIGNPTPGVTQAARFKGDPVINIAPIYKRQQADILGKISRTAIARAVIIV